MLHRVIAVFILTLPPAWADPVFDPVPASDLDLSKGLAASKKWEEAVQRWLRWTQSSGKWGAEETLLLERITRQALDRGEREVWLQKTTEHWKKLTKSPAQRKDLQSWIERISALYLQNEHYQQAQTALDQLVLGRARPAREAFARVIELEPGHREVTADLALAWVLEGESEKGLALYRTLAELYPWIAEYAEWKGKLLLMQGKYDEARIAFESALVLQPGLERATVGIAEIDFAQRRYKEAVTRLDAFLKQDADSLLATLTWIRLAYSWQGMQPHQKEKSPALKNRIQESLAHFKQKSASVEARYSGKRGLGLRPFAEMMSELESWGTRAGK